MDKSTEKMFKGKDGQLHSLTELQALLSENWSNDACMGYAILSLEYLKYSKKEIQNIIDIMRSEFDETSIKGAEKKYKSSPY